MVERTLVFDDVHAISSRHKPLLQRFHRHKQAFHSSIGRDRDTLSIEHVGLNLGRCAAIELLNPNLAKSAHPLLKH